MPAKCLGHDCTERRYRATNVKASSVTGQSGTCPKDKDILDATVKRLGDEAAEKEVCPEGCTCVDGTWPAQWTTLEKGVTFSGRYINLDCQAKVSFTYDWEFQEKTGKCYRSAPTKDDTK